MLVVGIEMRKLAVFQLAGTHDTVISEAALQAIHRRFKPFKLLTFFHRTVKVELLKINIKIPYTYSDTSYRLEPIIVFAEKVKSAI